MVIQNRQWPTANTISEQEVPFEICLPHLVAVFLFKPLIRLMLYGFHRIKETIAFENVAAGFVAGQPFYTGSF